MAQYLHPDFKKFRPTVHLVVSHGMQTESYGDALGSVCQWKLLVTGAIEFLVALRQSRQEVEREATDNV